MIPFPSRLPAGYTLYAHGTDLVLRYGSEDTVFSWFAVLPVRDPGHAVNVAMEVDERIQQDRERRRRWWPDMQARINGEWLRNAAREAYPWHPWGGMERGV